MAASEGFIPYIADPLGHSGLIMESKTFDKMDGKNSLSVIVSPKITLIFLVQFIQNSTLLYLSRRLGHG